ncbi:forkhead box protein J1-B-like isoform X2 [Esox lucius]|uniref:Fork-head domain-containing protein n=3 Tax=Esox lucius TaxID=8010 RepID=A0AAY5KCF1_ESOLU|nr:forkhead box protein J1-B-like isoform X2 [Esox lucius]XP_019906431.2 forkhead box protein J1-B-like isoform X2 [Esox lucius]
MPVLPSQDMSTRFKEEWINLPEVSDSLNVSVQLDDSLTSLQWLQNYSILSASLASLPGSTCQPYHLSWQSQPHSKVSDSPHSPSAGETAATGMPQSTGNPITSRASADRTRYSLLLQTVHNNDHQIPVPARSAEEVDYMTNHQVKPPYSYATMICMAMRASKQNKITLSAIYNWIKENFCYYRHAEPSWQNSIRHNLSLNKCFVKVPRRKDEPGKGGFWQIDSQHADLSVDGVFRRRRMPATHFYTQKNSKNHQSSQNRITQNHHLDRTQAHRRVSQRGAGAGHKPLRGGTKWATVHKSTLLTSNLREPEVLKGELDWAMVFDDILNGNSNDIDNLDMNLAVNTPGWEMELSHQESQGPGCHPGTWQGDGDHQHTHWSTGMNHDTTGGYSVDEVQQHLNLTGRQQQRISLAVQPQRHQEHQELTQFPEEQHRHPWEELKEEVPEVPITLDYTLNYCECFFTRMQPWGQ